MPLILISPLRLIITKGHNYAQVPRNFIINKSMERM